MTMRALSHAAALAAALALAGCSGAPSLPSLNPIDWFTSKPTGPKPAELPVLTNAQAVKLLWSASIGASEGFFFSPIMIGDGVYAASRAGTVTRLDAASGQSKWRISLGKRISSGVGGDATLVVLAAEDGEVFALDAQSGIVKWRARVSSEVLAQPKVGEGQVLVRSADSRIFAFGVEDGKRRWVYQRPAAALIVRSPVGLTAAQGSAYAGFSGGRADISTADPSGRACGQRRIARYRLLTDDQSRALRHPMRSRTRLREFLSERVGVPARDAVPAVFGFGEYSGASRQSGRRFAIGRRAGFTAGTRA